MDSEELAKMQKAQIPQKTTTLTPDDIRFLVETLSEKDDKLRYNAFLLVQAAAKRSNTIYGYWDVLEQKLNSDNSYQRSIGVMLIAENVRWDTEGKFGGALPKFLACCNDEKFITARQTLQAFVTIIKSTDAYNKAIGEAVAGLSFAQYKENQQSLLRKDAANVLAAIRRR
ncbi:MAG: hypothetical protein NWE93_13405 [Candidatus Bathyarchaeota archaeon]|nr:hypothetical protein [Candidatus Bathyarchaeota archaeon]